MTKKGIDLDRYTERIRRFGTSQFEVRTEATIRHRERAYPMLSVRSPAASAAKTLLVLAGVHGDEPAGLLAVPAMLEAWSAGHVRLVVVTPVNPAGAAKGARRNAQGRDINRDFLRFETPEARAVRDVFDEVRPDFVISLHEGPQRGAFMFANRFVEASFAASVCDALAAGGSVLAERDYLRRRLHPPGFAPASALIRVAWDVGAALGQKATIAYSEDRGVPEIVLEGSFRAANEAERIRPHVDVVAAVARRL